MRSCTFQQFTKSPHSAKHHTRCARAWGVQIFHVNKGVRNSSKDQMYHIKLPKETRFGWWKSHMTLLPQKYVKYFVNHKYFIDFGTVPTLSRHRKPPASPPTALAQNVGAYPCPARIHPECDVDLSAKTVCENRNRRGGERGSHLGKLEIYVCLRDH